MRDIHKPESNMDIKPLEKNTEQSQSDSGHKEAYNTDFCKSWNRESGSYLFGKKKESSDPREMSQQKLKEGLVKNELPQADREMKSYIKDKGLDKYISEDKLKPSIAGNTKVLTSSEMKKELKGKYLDEMDGFNNGKNSYVDAGLKGSEFRATAIHENFHQYSHNDGREGVKVGGKNEGLNEAITQNYTTEAMKHSGSDYNPKDNLHNKNAEYINKFQDFEGNKEMFADAYFNNKPELLKEHFDSVCGKGFFDDLSKNMDKAVYGKSDEIKEKAQKDIENQFKTYKFNREAAAS